MNFDWQASDCVSLFDCCKAISVVGTVAAGIKQGCIPGCVVR